MKIVLASRNRNKIKEIKGILRDVTGEEFEILSLDDIGYTDEIEENGKAFEENALIKAGIPAKMGYIGIGDDTGLCVEALNGEPGIYSARYSGPDCNDERNNAKLLEEMRDVPESNRKARFVCAIACVAPNGKSFIVRGTCDGKILKAPRGKNGFGYDPLFLYSPLAKTFAELDFDEKNKISHRSRALNYFADKFPAFAEKL